MNTYFDGKGTYQGTFDKLWGKHVPAQGPSSSRHGEAVRCIARFSYEIYNNGAGNALNYDEDSYSHEFDHYYDDMATYLETYCRGNGKASMYHRLMSACKRCQNISSQSEWNDVAELFEPLMDEVVARAAHDEKIIPTA